MKTVPVLITTLTLLATAVATADDVMPKSRADALAMEAQDALPLTRFYDPPPLGKRIPGTLLRSEPFNGYSLPPGRARCDTVCVAGARWHTRCGVGSRADPRGFAAARRLAGHRLGAWHKRRRSHVAPSLMKDIEYGSEGLMPMVAAGFAVIATDYAGLGTRPQSV